MQSTADVTSFFARRRIIDSTASQADTSLSAAELDDSRGHDILSFLATAQCNDIDFLPITWHAALGKLSAGGTAQIQQSFLNLELSYVFKRIHRGIDEPHAFRALVSEISILGHKDIRGHPNIVRLAGITWDVLSASEAIWPTLVFRKSEHGDLRRFVKSSAGKNLDFDGRLKLCNDLAVGIAALHAVGVVHGDIKPMNVLVFSESKDKEMAYTAQLGDFGYSTLSNSELENAKDVHLPISWPWNAPEVSNWESSFPTHEAKLTDVFSFGLLCLWLLFPGGLSEVGVDVERPSRDAGWKRDGNLERIASSVVERQSQLSESRKTALTELFVSTLVTDANRRDLDIRGLMKKVITVKAAEPQGQTMSNYGMYTPYLRWIPNHKDFDVAAAQEAHYGSSYYNPYATASASWNPYTYQNPYANESLSEPNRSHPPPVAEAPQARSQPAEFLVWKSFRQLVQSDYRIWATIFNALRNRMTSPVLEEREDAAFQLAFCYEIGFGTAPESARVTHYLEKGGRTYENLLREINTIKEDRHPLVFKNLETKIDKMDHISHYLNTVELTDVVNAYDPIAEASSRLFGEDHRTSIYLRRTLGGIFEAQGKLDKAQAVFSRLASVCEANYDSRHPDTLAILSSVAQCHSAQGNIKQAEEIMVKIMEIQAMIYSDEVQDQVPSMRQLASIYREQQRWKDAEELETKILDINEKNLGKCHIDTLVAVSDLIENYKHQGPLFKAEELALDLIDRTVDQFGEDDSRALESMDVLGSVYIAMGNFDAATNLANRAADIRKRTLSPDHEDIRDSMLTLVNAHSGAGQFEKAVQIQREAVDQNKRVLGTTHRHTVRSMETLATLLAKQQNYEEAADVMAAVVAHRKLIQGDTDPDTVASIATWEEYKKEKARDRLAAFVEMSRMKNAAATTSSN
ncbi:hypothetical protein Dda_4313 [Drechslerella dactyloides]|uniref:Protein kinase domain-containing protein n=1 Tax=Drechslerella dactyloides TaxID=74499 RepID=A0AAD6NJ54_DREDA|nr:hypothetical protein Dda_4313 [Drechslerella dactyloides]